MPDKAPASYVEMEEWVIKRATKFSTVLTLGAGQKDRTDWPTLREAIDWARGNPRMMVYAATDSGRAVMIAPAQYSIALKIVGSEA